MRRVSEAVVLRPVSDRGWVPGAEAEVDLRVGGRFRLSMQLDGGPMVAVGEYREITPPERLVFTWMWEGDPQGEETLVTLALRGVEGGTELTLSHGGFGAAEVAENHRQGWRDCVERLADLAPAVDREIRFETFIAASPDRVWRAVESQEAVRRWLGQRAEFEPGLGGRVRIFDTTGEWVMGGEIIEWVPGRRMTFTWAGLEPVPHAATRFTFELIPEGEGTRVVLRHHYFLYVPESEYVDYLRGWGTGQRQPAEITAIAAEAA